MRTDVNVAAPRLLNGEVDCGWAGTLARVRHSDLGGARVLDVRGRDAQQNLLAAHEYDGHLVDVGPQFPEYLRIRNKSCSEKRQREGRAAKSSVRRRGLQVREVRHDAGALAVKARKTSPMIPLPSRVIRFEAVEWKDKGQARWPMLVVVGSGYWTKWSRVGFGSVSEVSEKPTNSVALIIQNTIPRVLRLAVPLPFVVTL